MHAATVIIDEGWYEGVLRDALKQTGDPDAAVSKVLVRKRHRT